VVGDGVRNERGIHQQFTDPEAFGFLFSQKKIL